MIGETAASWVWRAAPGVIFFAVAFAVDMATGQRYSSVWGSAAIIASAVSLFPAIGPALAAFGGYAAIWIGFNVVRAVADNTGGGLAGAGAASAAESALFGGRLPSGYLQSRFFDPEHVDIIDVALSVVHGSFFVTPFLVAGIIWWKRRALFRQYAVATAICFAIGLIGFLFLPTAPPWLSDPSDVARVTRHVLASGSGGPVGNDSRFWFEPNHLAALPSVHVAAVVLVFLALMHFGRTGAVVGGVYAVAMTGSVVYLGEHFVIDAVLGWVVALAGWRLARRWLGEERARNREW